MNVVVDASVVVVLVSGDPRRLAVEQQFRSWTAARDDRHAPALLPYEVASGLTRQMAAGAFPPARLALAWHTALDLPITYHSLHEGGDDVIVAALKLGRKSAYDAAYLVLAQRLDADLWTFDGPLARNATGVGFPVRLIT